jgi:PTH2 family peptidyl-tRNA hydrolase
MSLKQVILVRKDLKLPKGKMAAQVSHASVEAVLKTDKSLVKEWQSSGMEKVVVLVKDKEELYKYIQHAKDSGITTSVITDAGRTVVEPGTVTCGAIGPDEENRIDNITGSLKLA